MSKKNKTLYISLVNADGKEVSYPGFKRQKIEFTKDAINANEIVFPAMNKNLEIQGAYMIEGNKKGSKKVKRNKTEKLIPWLPKKFSFGLLLRSGKEVGYKGYHRINYLNDSDCLNEVIGTDFYVNSKSIEFGRVQDNRHRTIEFLSLFCGNKRIFKTLLSRSWQVCHDDIPYFMAGMIEIPYIKPKYDERLIIKRAKEKIQKNIDEGKIELPTGMTIDDFEYKVLSKNKLKIIPQIFGMKE